MLPVFRREVKSYFYSPVAYVLIGFFILISSLFFWPNLNYQYGNFNGNLANMGFTLIFIIPILTMRILAEDRKNGTEILLLTSPTSITGIVLGKYLATLVVFLTLTAITFAYPIILIAYGGSFTVQLVGGYLGFILLGAAFISIGIFASSLTENQIISAIITFVSLLIIWLADNIGNMVGGLIAKVAFWISLLSRYGEFNEGILSLSSIIYYFTFIGIFLFLTVRVIEKRRWSQG